jgi:hypothetical protein
MAPRSLMIAVALMLSVSAAASQATAAAPGRISFGGSALFSRSLLVGPTLGFRVLDSGRLRLDADLSAMWSPWRIGPGVCIDTNPPICNGLGPAASRLVSIGARGRIAITERFFLATTVGYAESWWVKPERGAHRSPLIGLGIGMDYTARDAIELRGHALESNVGREGAVLVAWRRSW